MDRKTPKKRKAKKSKSNGRSEEKPKVSEVTTEKEEEDRLEAANVLSSLMFLPQLRQINQLDPNSFGNSRPRSTRLSRETIKGEGLTADKNFITKSFIQK